MKILLILAFLCCCVIGGIVGAGCECDMGMKKCFCQSAIDNVVKVRVKDSGEEYFEGNSGKFIFRVKQMKSYKGNRKFKYVVVPNGCEKNIKKGERYIMMGRKSDNDKKTLQMRKPNGWIKVQDNLSDDQNKFLRNPDCD